jgi:hypothetical protein
MESEVCMTSHPTNASLTQPDALGIPDIDRIQALFDAATPGPWEDSRLAPAYILGAPPEDTPVCSVGEYEENGELAYLFRNAAANRAAIIAAHNTFPRLLALAREALTQEGRALELERRVKELEREATERGYAYLELRQNAEQERDDFARRCLEHMRLNLSTDGKGGYSLPEADTILAAVKADLAQKEHSHD